MTAAHATSVFAKRDIADVMGAILDGPVSPPQTEQAPRRGAEHGQAGDGIGHFCAEFLAAAHRAFHAADLLYARPIQEVVAAVGGSQTACFGAVAVLVVLDRLARLNLPELLL